MLPYLVFATHCFWNNLDYCNFIYNTHIGFYLLVSFLWLVFFHQCVEGKHLFVSVSYQDAMSFNHDADVKSVCLGGICWMAKIRGQKLQTLVYLKAYLWIP